ncbi:MAG: adenylate/guanylate cyclase domain-containing protein [Pirellulales bacterium]
MYDIAFYNPRQHRQFQRSEGAVVLARSETEPAVWTAIDRDPPASPTALVEILLTREGVELAMAGCELECHCGRPCTRKGHCRLEIPAQFSIGDTRFEINQSPAQMSAKPRPLQRLVADGPGVSRRADGSGPSPATLSRWFAALGALNHHAMSLQELYVQAARCAVDAIGLDGAMVLRRRDNEWEIAASYLPHPELGIHCELAALDQLLGTPQTLFHGNDSTTAKPQSPLPAGCHNPQSIADDPTKPPHPVTPLNTPPAIILSPLRNAAGQLTGALYGYRSVRPGNSRRGLRYLEAHWFELLAGAVTDGIVRLEREAEVERRRVMLERAFVATLDNDPRRMAGETREVTMLFADLRDFTRLSTMLGMEVIYELLGHVMDCLTAAVMDHDGLVIDYYGDGLAAMWNAPADQAEHAELACRAGLRMLEAVPEVVADWANVLDRGLQLGVGVHTGPVHVGNAGSTRRMKYGPRGANVNLASRVESATKSIGLPMLITGATARQLSNRIATHRICRARLPGVDDPLELYTAYSAATSSHSSDVWAMYSEVLRLFEAGDYENAAAKIGELEAVATSVPAKFLAEQIQRELGRQRHRRADDHRSIVPGVIALTQK